ncbi:MAG: class I SAM-dependent methyltransferase [Promethearchaeota archaeon]
MTLMEKMVNQARKPDGKFGKIFTKGMNKGAHAKMAEWALKYIPIKLDANILDIGCGGGGNIDRMTKIAVDGKVYGIDYSEVSINTSKKVNKKNIEKGIVEIKHSSVSNLPFLENTFDLITGFEAYYFWPDLVNDLKGIYKVLKPGGTLALTNEAYKCKNEKLRKRSEKWSKIGHFDIHSPDEFREFLTKAGYSEIEIIEEEKKGWILIKGKKKY